jgi:multidrug efflux pump subunit AcrA (membrane-fusion protein)
MQLLARFALVGLMLGLPALATAQGRPAGVTTAIVTTSSMAETVSVFGEVVAGRESAVAARVGGVAQDVPIRIGDLVEEGDVLARRLRLLRRAYQSRRRGWIAPKRRSVVPKH